MSFVASGRWRAHQRRSRNTSFSKKYNILPDQGNWIVLVVRRRNCPFFVVFLCHTQKLIEQDGTINVLALVQQAVTIALLRLLFTYISIPSILDLSCGLSFSVLPSTVAFLRFAISLRSFFAIAWRRNLKLASLDSFPIRVNEIKIIGRNKHASARINGAGYLRRGAGCHEHYRFLHHHNNGRPRHNRKNFAKSSTLFHLAADAKIALLCMLSPSSSSLDLLSHHHHCSWSHALVALLGIIVPLISLE